MAIRVAIYHHMQYQYDRMVFLSPQLVRLKPAAHCRALIKSYSLSIEPENHVVHWQQDPFGNFIARVDFWDAMQMMNVKVELIADLEPVNPFDFFIDTYAESFPFTYEDSLKKDLAPYLELTEQGSRFTEWLAKIDQTKQDTVEFLTKLNQQVYQTIAYTTRFEPGVQTAEETVQLAIGSCRDSGWLLVQTLRYLGLAARFVSGYLVQLAATGTKTDDLSNSITDSLALHAWAEVYVPGAGWIGLDPTSGMLATEGHIPLACTPEPSSAAAITGTAGQSESTLSYTNTLVRLN